MLVKKLKIAVLTGGKSSEHEVSLQSAKNVIAAIDKTKYEVLPIGIDKKGRWWLYDNFNYLVNENDPKNIKLHPNSGEQVVLLPQVGGELYSLTQNKTVERIDCVFSLLHGNFGEDGNTQGLLNLAGVPFVGSDVLGSAVGMDKDVTKRLLRDAGIPVSKFITLQKGEYANLDSIFIELGSPLFVKPANEGSSVGVSKARNKEELKDAIVNAFKYDTKVLVEEFIDGREIECAILGNLNPKASVIGEIKPNHEFYSYEAKYLDADGAKAIIPAEISEETSKDVKEIAMKAFKVLCCSGLARVDFFLKKDGSLLINEINTLPGFTKISMYPQLWQESGMTYTELITTLIELALEKAENEKS
jgi:D-alanine-D-alanine ligase